mmetsp:Transcript_10325/g.31948  ORF Transcript_10325/g.31948 Transcript_10325/m.31948 type:complete len:242 (+) Transcript_10325:1425-2150(+)
MAQGAPEAHPQVHRGARRGHDGAAVERERHRRRCAHRRHGEGRPALQLQAAARAAHLGDGAREAPDQHGRAAAPCARQRTTRRRRGNEQTRWRRRQLQRHVIADADNSWYPRRCFSVLSCDIDQTTNAFVARDRARTATTVLHPIRPKIAARRAGSARCRINARLATPMAALSTKGRLHKSLRPLPCALVLADPCQHQTPVVISALLLFSSPPTRGVANSPTRATLFICEARAIAAPLCIL